VSKAATRAVCGMFERSYRHMQLSNCCQIVVRECKYSSIVMVFRFPIVVWILTTKGSFFAANFVNLLSDNENIVVPIIVIFQIFYSGLNSDHQSCIFCRKSWHFSVSHAVGIFLTLRSNNGFHRFLAFYSGGVLDLMFQYTV
jgi:hypothetical protein